MPPEARNRNIIPQVQMNPANLIKMDIHNYDELKINIEGTMDEYPGIEKASCRTDKKRTD
jgi:hypothetical protein